MNVINEQQNNPDFINDDVINNINNNNYIIFLNNLIPLDDFPVLTVEGENFTALQLLLELENWIDRIQIRTYLNAMIEVDILNEELDDGVPIEQDNIDNININFENVEGMDFTENQGMYIEKVGKFIELCNIDEMRDFIIHMNHRF